MHPDTRLNLEAYTREYLLAFIQYSRLHSSSRLEQLYNFIVFCYLSQLVCCELIFVLEHGVREWRRTMACEFTFMLTSTPWSNRYSTILGCPLSQARCNAV